MKVNIRTLHIATAFFFFLEKGDKRLSKMRDAEHFFYFIFIFSFRRAKKKKRSRIFLSRYIYFIFSGFFVLSIRSTKKKKKKVVKSLYIRKALIGGEVKGGR